MDDDVGARRRIMLAAMMAVGVVLRGLLAASSFRSDVAGWPELESSTTSAAAVARAAFLAEQGESPLTDASIAVSPTMLLLADVLGVAGASPDARPADPWVGWFALQLGVHLAIAGLVFWIGERLAEEDEEERVGAASARPEEAVLRRVASVAGEVIAEVSRSKEEGREVVDAAWLLTLRRWGPLLAPAVVLFHPALVLASVAPGLGWLRELACLACLASALSHRWALSAVSIAVVMHVEPGFAVLLPAWSLFLFTRPRHPDESARLPRVYFLVVALATTGLLAFPEMGAWWDLRVAARLTNPSLASSLGLDWYILSSVFGAHRPYFLLLVALQPFIVALPIVFLTRRHPSVAFAASLVVATLYRPNLAVPSIVLAWCAVLAHSGIIARLGSSAMVHVVLAHAAAAFFPRMRWLWQSTHAGNPNYLLNQTLLLAGTQGLLLTLWLGAYLRRRPVLHDA